MDDRLSPLWYVFLVMPPRVPLPRISTFSYGHGSNPRTSNLFSFFQRYKIGSFLRDVLSPLYIPLCLLPVIRLRRSRTLHSCSIVQSWVVTLKTYRAILLRNQGLPYHNSMVEPFLHKRRCGSYVSSTPNSILAPASGYSSSYSSVGSASKFDKLFDLSLKWRAGVTLGIKLSCGRRIVSGNSTGRKDIHLNFIISRHRNARISSLATEKKKLQQSWSVGEECWLYYAGWQQQRRDHSSTVNNSSLSISTAVWE
jgi:hypothetical protein